MSTFTACADSIYAPSSQPDRRCSHREPVHIENISEPYWNPNSERYETLQQSIQQGRKERALAICAMFGRLFGKLK